VKIIIVYDSRLEK